MFDSQHSQKNSEKKIVNVAKVNQQHLEECGQWLENVDQTNLVLASGKLGQQKRLGWYYVTF